MFDLETGDELWRAGPDASADLTLSDMKRSFPSEIRVLDLSGDGFANRMYAVDVGGQIWRFDITNGNAPSQLVAGGVIAQFGPEGQALVTPSNSRRFYSAPDVALLSDHSHDRTYLSINVGSGYRAHPLDSTASDRFYSLRDPDVFNRLTQSQYDSYSVAQDSDLVDVAGIFGVSLSLGSRGWKFSVPANEKILAEAAVFNDTVFFVTLEPNGGASDDLCMPGGNTNRVYRLDIQNGNPLVDPGTLDPDDPTGVDAARVTELEQGGVAVRPTFLFPSPLDAENCTGEDCAPPPIGCFGLECFDPGFDNRPVRNTWSHDVLE
jgi:type IV pilus assembly protein PilY1